MMRIVLATVCCILGSWGLVIKPNFCSDFEHKVSSRFWSWSSGKIFKLEFGQYFAADVLQRLWSWILVEILKMKFDQDLGLNLWYDPIGYFEKMNSTLGSVVPLAMFVIKSTTSIFSMIKIQLWSHITRCQIWKPLIKIYSRFYKCKISTLLRDDSIQRVWSKFDKRQWLRVWDSDPTGFFLSL